MINIDIVGIGKALPNNEVTSLSMDRKLGLVDGRIEKVTGLKQRYFINETSTALDMMYRAIEEALKDAKMEIDDIDCIINSSATMYQALPFNGATTVKLLQPSKPIASFDINMTCLSTLRAFDVASNLFGAYKNILIVSCDVPSIALDWSDIRTAGIFGDGAAALVVSKSTQGGILVSNFETHTDGFDHCQVRGYGSTCNPHNYEGDYKETSYFEMNGKKLYKLSSTLLPSFVNDTLASKSLCIEDIDWVVLHQASQASLDHIVKILKFDREKLIDIFATHGNQVASSIPTALHALLRTKDVKSGDKVLILGTSAGLGLGLVVWEVP